MHMVVYRLAQMSCVEVGVNLGCEDIFVTQKLLHLAYVGSTLQKVGCEGVAEGVRANLLIYTSIFCRLFDDSENHYSCKLRASVVKKNCLLFAAGGATLLQVELYAIAGNATYRHQSLLVALSSYADITLAKEEVAEF